MIDFVQFNLKIMGESRHEDQSIRMSLSQWLKLFTFNPWKTFSKTNTEFFYLFVTIFFLPIYDDFGGFDQFSILCNYHVIIQYYKNENYWHISLIFLIKKVEKLLCFVLSGYLQWSLKIKSSYLGTALRNYYYN